MILLLANAPVTFPIRHFVSKTNHDDGITLLMILKNCKKPTLKTSTQCMGDISHASKTAKITMVDNMMCKIPEMPLQDELLC